MTKKRLCFDIETDGLNASKIWCLVIQDLDTNEQTTYSDESADYKSIEYGLQELLSATVLIGHNIIGFDVPVVDKLNGTNMLLTSKLHDTWIMSQVLSFSRDFTQYHGLADWGEKLGVPKIEFDSEKFTRGNEPEVLAEMITYCQQDVALNVHVYETLLEELKPIIKRRPSFADGLRVEHDTAIFNQLAKRDGWNFDSEKAIDNKKLMTDRMGVIESILEPELGEYETVFDKERKLTRFVANGHYHSATARMLSELLGFHVDVSHFSLIPKGTKFQRTQVNKIKLGQIAHVKNWLLGRGWKPTEYTKRKVGNGYVNAAPKLTPDSLSQFGELGAMIGEYLTIRNRVSIITGWEERSDKGRIRGNMWTVGTATFRCRHEDIVNLPGVDAQFGKEIRELLRADEGYVCVGADSAGNQLRALCHYVNNPAFTKEVIHGDQHQRNAEALGCSRPSAKEYLYAYLFGAGDGKLGYVLSGTTNVQLGKKSRDKFADNIKGLAELKKKLVSSWRSNDSRMVTSLDGRHIFCKYEHQLLNYLLQTAEGITCKAAVSYAMRKIISEGLRAEPRLFYHDEICYQAHPDDAERVGEILTEAFTEAPKLFNVTCMAGGDYVIGKTYAEVH